MEKTLSIIIPTYNGKNYIKNTIDQALRIKTNKEIIIIDDGSSDETYEYCTKIYSGNSDVHVFRKKNGGIVSARNFGLTKCSGEYVAFCDHDDVLIPETIDKALSKAIKNNLDLVQWSTKRKICDSKLEKCDEVITEDVLESSEIYNLLIPSMIFNKPNSYISYLGHIWAGLYRRSVILEYEITFKKFVDIEDDFLFVLDYLLVCKKMQFMKDIGYLWTYNVNSETYRLKFIPDIYSKYQCLFDYIKSAVSSHINFSPYESRFEIYRKQYSLIRSVENDGTYLSNKASKIKIKKILKQPQNAEVFQKSEILYLSPAEKRRKRIFKMLHLNLPGLALKYVYLDSLYRKIMNHN